MSTLPNHFLLSAEIRRDQPFEEDVYPFCIPVVRRMERIEFHPKVTFFVGENGSGKSTILEAVALRSGFGPEGGTKNVQFATADTTSDLSKYFRLARGHQRPSDAYFLRAESFYNVLLSRIRSGILDHTAESHCMSNLMVNPSWRC